MKDIFLLLFAIIIGCTSIPTNNKGNNQNSSDDFLSTSPKLNKAQPDTITQKYLFTDLSNKYNYIVEYFMNNSKDNQKYGCAILIINKNTNAKTDSIFLELSSDVKNLSLETRSYITGKDTSKKVEDNFFGKLVIVDINFDNNEDIAILSHIGSNTGGIYTFYTQGDNEKFKVDTFLSNKVGFFPYKINRIKKQILTYINPNTNQKIESTYQLNTTRGEWEMLKQRSF